MLVYQSVVYVPVHFAMFVDVPVPVHAFSSHWWALCSRGSSVVHLHVDLSCLLRRLCSLQGLRNFYVCTADHRLM